MYCTGDDGEFDWLAACVECEKEHQRWSNFTENVNHYSIVGDFAVDAVHVLQVNVDLYSASS